MKLFILAAGTGSRLYPLTKNTPKSLIDLGDGTTLLERQIENAIKCKDINELVIITGYKTEQIEAKIKIYTDKIKVNVVYNPFYDISNNLLSLWCAKDLMLDNDFMITNGDNIYKQHVFDQVIDKIKKIQNAILLTTDYKEKYDDDDMKVVIDDTEHIINVHKKIPIKKANGESVGLAIIKGANHRKLFVNKILELSKDMKYRDKFWLEIFNSLVEDGIKINSLNIEKDDWREMDFHPDIDDIRSKMIEKLI